MVLTILYPLGGPETGFNRPFTNISFTPTADLLLGAHSLRAGYELRRQRWDITVPAYLGEARERYVEARGF